MKIFKRIFSLTLCFFLFAGAVFAVNYPEVSGFVSDSVGLYSPGFKTELENKLTDLEKTTGSEIAVATVKTLEGQSVEGYAVKLFEKWRIGKEKQDNGLLLLISEKEREVRIEAGYGLEPYITDGRAGDIIRQDIIPEFKNGNYEAGTGKAVDSLIKYITDKDIAPLEPENKESEFPFLVFIIGFYILATYAASFLGRTKEIWPGGAIGGILGLGLGIVFTTVFAAVFIAVFAGLFGLFMDFILSKNYKIRKDRGLPTGFWGSGGGFSSGGGGSFGGFGGGSSGGGGASGRW